MRTPWRYYRHRRQRKLNRMTESARRYLQATLDNPTRTGVPETLFLDWEEMDDRMDLRHSSGFGKTARMTVYQSFTGLLMNFMRKRNRSAVILCRAARIPRSLLAEILSSQSYQPDRELVLTLTLALHLRMSEAELLMGAAGFAFSHEDPRDIVIEHCLRVHVYRLDRVNHLLTRLDIPALPYLLDQEESSHG